MKTKILSNLQIYILCCSHFTATSSICYSCSTLTENHHFASTALQKTLIVSKVVMYGHEIWAECVKYVDMKSKKICHQNLFHREVIDNLLIGVVPYKVGLNYFG